MAVLNALAPIYSSHSTKDENSLSRINDLFEEGISECFDSDTEIRHFDFITKCLSITSNAQLDFVTP